MDLISKLQSFGNRVAVVTQNGAEYSYADVLELTVARERQLARAGIGRGSVVGLEIADELQHLIASLALLSMNATHIALASHDTFDVKQTLASRVRATHHVIDSGVYPRDGMACDGQGSGVVLVKTSGTTAQSNIVPFTFEDLVLQAESHPEYADVRLLRLASIEHNNGKRHRLYCAIRGGVNVFRPYGEFDVAQFARDRGVTCIDMSRMHAASLIAQRKQGRFEGVKLRMGGSPVPYDVRRMLQEWVTPQVYVRYGMTEAGSISMAGPGDHDEAETVGQLLPGVELEIVDEGGNAVPAAVPGHIRLRSAGMATDYFDNPEQSKSRFRDGWFWPGDMGCLREDGTLVVHGRRDEMIILNGLNIFPGEIERVLERHSAVLTAAALPLSSPVHGQIPVAAVELKPGHMTTAQELQSFARQHLALRAPRRILILDGLPRNSQHKVLKHLIAAAFDRRAHPGANTDASPVPWAQE